MEYRSAPQNPLVTNYQTPCRFMHLTDYAHSFILLIQKIGRKLRRRIELETRKRPKSLLSDICTGGMFIDIFRH